ncbi:MAG: carbohydrate binding family 9 domain-containing protein [Gemmatimonadetes bacterium]|nr:carbohydrate binding family 9 domain-containing protein [Gemmatimonadota bacterium]
MRRALRHSRCFFFLLLPFCGSLIPGWAAAQEAATGNRPGYGGAAAAPGRTLRLEAATGDIRVDGGLDDAAWSAAHVAEGFVQQAPDEGAAASQPTKAYVLTDGRSLYVGARLTDADPGAIVARLARRDQDVLSDWFYVYIDGHRDRRSALGFGVNAAGVQRDVRIADDDRVDASWDAVWESAARRDVDGWTVELRIPLSQLRFEPGATEEWGLQLERRIARVNERSLWSPVPLSGDRFASLFGALRGVQSLAPGRGIELMPYAAVRMTGEAVSPDDPFRSALQPHAAIGADLRASLGSGFTLSATLNPDFGQVEADPAVVNLSAFEIFQDERRPFFVEGGDVFQMALPSWPPLFYSRRIGRSPQAGVPGDAAFADAPAASTILGAAKVIGRTRGWTLGLMEAVTARETAPYLTAAGEAGEVVVEPLTSHSAARVARQFRDGRSGIGFLGTAAHRDLADERLRSLHSAAYAAGVDGWHRFAGDAIELRFGAVTSHVRGDSTAILRTQRAAGHYFQRPDADHLTLDPSRTSLFGTSITARLQNVRGSWRWGTAVQATSPGYEVADLGFNPGLDYREAMAWLRYESYTPGSLFRSWRLGSAGMYEGTTAGERIELTGDLGFHFQLLNYWGGGIWAMRHQPAWEPHQLRGGPALRKPGRWMGSFSVDSDRRRSVRGEAFLFWEVEDDTDGYRVNSSASLAVRPSPRLDLRVGPFWVLQRDASQFIGTQTVADETLYLVGGVDRATIAASLRADYTFSPELSLQLYARPYLAAGRYHALREVADPHADAFDTRFRTYGDDEVAVAPREDGRRVFHVDRDGDGAADFQRPAPDFNLRSFQLNVVARWQYSPGSTLFAVWSHDREGRSPEAADFGRDLDALAGLRGRHVLMVKASYWLGL